MKKIKRDYLFLFSIAGIIIIVDQITKSIVRANLAVGEMWAPWDWLMPYARFVHVQNEGVAFGMLQGAGGIFAILALIVAGVIIYAFPRIAREDRVLRLALAMQLAGALGNVIDRIIFQGKVTDFISVGNFAVFNVADSSITIGVIILMIDVVIQEIKSARAKKKQDSNEELENNGVNEEGRRS